MLCEWHDIFEIVETNTKNFKKLYTPRFKHSGTTLNKASFTREGAEGIAFNWVNSKNNQKEILDIITEMALLVE